MNNHPLNTLAFRTHRENGLSFELLVDGTPLWKLIGASFGLIPFWLVEVDPPGLPLFGDDTDLALRLVAMCECGEPGCGQIHARIVQAGNFVEWSGFEGDVSRHLKPLRFKFLATNQDQILGEMATLSRNRRPATP